LAKRRETIKPPRVDKRREHPKGIAKPQRVKVGKTGEIPNKKVKATGDKA